MNKMYVERMLVLQEKFNNETNGVEWVNNITKEGKVINWPLCIAMESSEVIDCFPWKHWKNIDDIIDIDNLKVELVDIWHFIMSETISQHENGVLTQSPDDFFIEVIESNEIHYDNSYLAVSGFDEDEALLHLCIDLFRNSFDLKKVTNIFFSIIKFMQMNDYYFSIEQLYKLYIGKNALNRVRQLNGYKTGEYQKLWYGEEDNVSMQNYVNSTEVIDLSFDGCVSALNDIYHSVISKEKN